MQKHIDRSQFSTSALIKLGLLPKPNPKKIGIGHIVAVSIDADKPLFIRGENGAVFSIGGLTDNQKQVIPNLLPELIGSKVFFKFDTENELGQATDGIFQTLLLDSDTSPRAMALKTRLATIEGAVQ